MPDLASVIRSDPAILGRTPVFAGTRVPVRILIEYLTAGDSLEKFLDSYPSVLREQAPLFDNPVVLAVGDTHIFRVDKPLYRRDGSLVENFTRVETFGDPLVHWVRVTVDLRDSHVFTFHQELVPGNERVVHARLSNREDR